MIVMQLFFIESSIAQTNNANKFMNSVNIKEIWDVNNLCAIGGFSLDVFGTPIVKEFPEGKAIIFDGVGDGIIVLGNTINNSASFTAEIIFKPFASYPNNIEQRFLHIQKPNVEGRRVLLELRLNDSNEWYVDTHIRADSTFLTSIAKDFPHKVDQWYHLALVYDNGIASHYVNGYKEMSGRVNFIPIDSGQVSIGMRMNKKSFFKGAIKTVRLTPAALNPSQFLSLNLMKKDNDQLLYEDNFEMNNGNWISEFENPNTSKVEIKNGRLDLIASAGATVWFKHKLSGNVMITYNAEIVDSGNFADRVSDLNTFWMAQEPANNSLFTRDGKFSSYDNLTLYYAGIGGHNNTTSRFRKYNSTGQKPVVQEFLDKEHLLVGNRKYEVKIIVDKGRTKYYLNDILFFDFMDENPLKEGYFGFRTTKSHQRFDNFKVYRIKEKAN